MNSIAIVMNPHSRALKTDPSIHRQFITTIGDQGRVYLTSSLDALNQTMHSLQQNPPKIIGIVGGDGTVTCTLSALHQNWGQCSPPPIVVLGGGTVNVLARNLGFTRPPLDNLKSVLAGSKVNANLPTVEIPTLRADSILGFQFAAGAAVHFLEAFYANKGSARDAAQLVASLALGAVVPPPLRATLLNAKQSGAFDEIVRCTPFAIRIEESNTQKTRPLSPISLIFSSTIPRIAFGLPLFSDLALGDGRASLLTTATTGQRFLRAALACAVGRPPKEPEVTMEFFHSLELSAPTPFKWTLDGEIFEATESRVTVEIGPRFMFYSMR